jgi:hypothetical protein
VLSASEQPYRILFKDEKFRRKICVLFNRGKEENTMTDKHDAEQNAEQTLITLDQLSQTLEVMSCVVERLKQHLDRQLSLTAELFEDEQKVLEAEQRERKESAKQLQQDSFVVEITHREMEEGADHTVH